jgi:hypothetical protein
MKQKINLDVDMLDLQDKELLEKIHALSNIVALKMKKEADSGILSSNGKYAILKRFDCSNYSDDLDILYNEFIARIHAILDEYSDLFSIDNVEFLNAVAKKGAIKLSQFIKDIENKLGACAMYENVQVFDEHIIESIKQQDSFSKTKEKLYTAMQLLSKIKKQQSVDAAVESIKKTISLIEFLEQVASIVGFIEAVNEKVIPSKNGDIKVALSAEYSEMADAYVDFSKKFGKVAIYINDDRSLLYDEQNFFDIENNRYPNRKWIIFDGDNTKVLRETEYIEFSRVSKSEYNWTLVGVDWPDYDTRYHVSLDGVHASRLIPKIYIDMIRKILETKHVRLIDKNALLAAEKI